MTLNILILLTDLRDKTMEQQCFSSLKNQKKLLLNFYKFCEIKCTAKLSLTWIKNCALTTAAIGANAIGADSATFEKTDAKLYVPVVTLSTEDSAKLIKQLSEGFKRPVYWNKYKVIDNRKVDIDRINDEEFLRELLDSNYQGVKRLFLLMIIQQVIITFLLILSKNTPFKSRNWKLQHQNWWKFLWSAN